MAASNAASASTFTTTGVPLEGDVTSGARVPLWFDKGVRHDPYPQLTVPPTDVDVCVVGAGIAGLSVAYNCAHHGLKVVVVDDGEIGSGETSRSSAHCFSWMDDFYQNVEHLHGTKGARLVAESHQEAIDFIDRVCKYEKIDCGMRRLDGWLIQQVPDMPQFSKSPEGKGVMTMVRELEASQRAGCEGVEMHATAPIQGINTGQAIRFPLQGAIQPVKYINGLARAATSRGAQIFSRTRIVDFDHDKTNAIAKTANNINITARHLVLATNTPINNKLTVHAKLKNQLSYVIAAEIPKGSYTDALFWDTSVDPAYHYVRFEQTGDDTAHDYIIVGGEDHMVGKPSHSGPEIFRRLEHWTRQLWPQMGPVRYQWSGQIMEPVDALAYIGRNPGDYNNVYIVTGDSGNGITHGTIAGMLLCDLIVGRPNPWADVYDPARKTLRTMPEMLQHDVEINMQYKDYLLPGDVSDIEDLGNGCGGIIRRGFRKYAVYKDEKGVVHESSAVCPHLGGVVRWNANEKTFDCPVHGSRFDRFGRVVHGPAKTDLERVGQYATDSAKAGKKTAL
eukprot:Unigene5843_Nuclearia_a/m.17845 Unigene5843_Nuclearia_a/g.17845  ORF Unigene5843_Nuclearia_a/g.17845 Unigene5843_Nuclearia_a/m.17845 type:complete len:562 (-) Unigene5843_Nuclearia_a:119-1804(-)